MANQAKRDQQKNELRERSRLIAAGYDDAREIAHATAAHVVKNDVPDEKGFPQHRQEYDPNNPGYRIFSERRAWW